jgi:acyl-CoA thioesterase
MTAAVPELAAAPSILESLLEAPGPVVVDPSWWSWSGPHGGLLAALALRCCAAHAGSGRGPRALTVQLLRSPGAERLERRAQVVRDGGSSSTVTAVLTGSDGGPSVLATLTSGRSRGGGSGYAAVPMPEVAVPLDCPEVAPPVELVPHTQHFDFRLASGPDGFGGASAAEYVFWVRLRSDEPLDAARLAVVADAVPPALYALLPMPIPVPTVEVSYAFASGTDDAPRRGWVLVRIATRTAADGWCVDDSDVWAPDGQLLVQSRQTRRVLGDLTR